MWVCLCTKLTDKPDDVEGGVGENGCAGLTEVVVGLLFASYGVFGHADACKEKKKQERSNSAIHVNSSNLLQMTSRVQHLSVVRDF